MKSIKARRAAAKSALLLRQRIKKLTGLNIKQYKEAVKTHPAMCRCKLCLASWSE
jgi:hypothetical protein